MIYVIQSNGCDQFIVSKGGNTEGGFTEQIERLGFMVYSNRTFLFFSIDKENKSKIVFLYFFPSVLRAALIYLFSTKMNLMLRNSTSLEIFSS